MQVWLASGLHALPAMMRMQPDSEFQGTPIPPVTGPIAIELSEASVTFGRGARAVRVGMAFQNPTMLPWMTIERNIMLPLKIVEPFRSQFRKLRNTEFRDKANALLEQVG